jgi:hypothetical protein
MDHLYFAQAEPFKKIHLATLNRKRREQAFTFFCICLCLIFARAREQANLLANHHVTINQQTEMPPKFDAFLRRWHRMLGLAHYSPPSWYRDRLREELYERRTAKTPLLKLSETSDVFFSIIRAHYDGFPVRKLPPFVASPRYVILYGYMLAKFTLRWAFFRTAAMLCRAPNHDMVREVVNPGKDHKLDVIALRYQLDPDEFKRVCRRLRRLWPLLP